MPELQPKPEPKPEPKPQPNPTQIEFAASHVPQLVDGAYTITVEQKFTVDSITATPANKLVKHFAVQGERFSLKPADFQAIFPPESSLGNYQGVLPHVILERSTLPWERSTRQDKSDKLDKSNKSETVPPWLALLLFAEGEAFTSQSVTVDTLKTAVAKGLGVWPGITLETAQNEAEKVTVIDVDHTLLKAILPTETELIYLAHARFLLAEGEEASEANERAVVVCNRLPQVGVANKTSIVHLVSLEGRYDKNGQFNYQQAGVNDTIRLISLKSWRFSCLSHTHTFTGLLTNLNKDSIQAVRLPAVPASKNSQPVAEADTTNKLLATGAVPVSHQWRNGQQSVSWYRGPLSPNLQVTADSLQSDLLPCQTADSLLRYDQNLGMFDVSYAAAWELGRLMALNSKDFSVGLYQWKRSHSQQMRELEQNELHPHLVHVQPEKKKLLTFTGKLEKWLQETSLLHDVPFNYLVPDDRMLPAESIRFFMLDPFWMACLLDGAFSVGRVTTADVADDHKRAKQVIDLTQQTVSGFLLRSAVVAGWPALQTDAYDSNNKKLTRLRMALLSPNVLLCLFAGEAVQFDIHQKKETIHFGFKAKEDGSYCKPLRASDGTEKMKKVQRNGKTEDVPKYEVAVPYRTAKINASYDEAKKVVAISQLYDNIDTKLKETAVAKDLNFKGVSFNAALFALQMVEGVPLVSFKK